MRTGCDCQPKEKQRKRVKRVICQRSQVSKMAARDSRCLYRDRGALLQPLSYGGRDGGGALLKHRSLESGPTWGFDKMTNNIRLMESQLPEFLLRWKKTVSAFGTRGSVIRSPLWQGKGPRTWLACTLWTHCPFTPTSVGTTEEWAFTF